MTVTDQNPAEVPAAGPEDLRLRRKGQSAPRQVATAIREAILDGTLLPGSRLPSEEKMAGSFGVSSHVENRIGESSANPRMPPTSTGRRRSSRRRSTPWSPTRSSAAASGTGSWTTW